MGCGWGLFFVWLGLGLELFVLSVLVRVSLVLSVCGYKNLTNSCNFYLSDHISL